MGCVTGSPTPGPDGPATTTAIHTEHLTKRFPNASVSAVDKLNLDVADGEIFGLLGPNGAGKTTTVGMLTIRVTPTAGSGFVGGIDLARHPAAARQLIGVVSQHNTLDRQLSVWQNLYFHGRLFGIGGKSARRRADDLLERFGLTKRATASVYALSGGMAQRLMIARAIFHRPALLFLDEPTAGLDPQGRLALWEILGELNQAGQTILLTTHYLEEAERLCTRLAIMDRGRILAAGTPAELRRGIDASTIVTIRTTGATARLATLLTTEIAGVARTRQAGTVLELHVQGEERLIPRIVVAAEAGGFELSDVSISQPGLETVFIALTGREFKDQ